MLDGIIRRLETLKVDEAATQLFVESDNVSALINECKEEVTQIIRKHKLRPEDTEIRKRMGL